MKGEGNTTLPFLFLVPSDNENQYIQDLCFHHTCIPSVMQKS